MSNKLGFLKQDTLEQYKKENDKFRNNFFNYRKSFNIIVVIIFLVLLFFVVLYSFFPIFSVRYKLSESSFGNSIENKIIEDYYQADNIDGRTLPLKDIQGNNKDIESLQMVVEKELSSLTGSYGVYVENLKNQESIGINKDKKFTAASLDKLFVAASYYKQMQDDPNSINGNIGIKKENIIINQKDKKDGVSAGDIFGSKELVQSMLNQSDNTAYLTLVDEISLGYIEKFIKNGNYKNTNFLTNDSSPEDIGSLLKKIYYRELFSESMTSEMLGFMQNTTVEDRIPFYLPSSVKVSHKIGSWDGTYSDAGIVYSRAGDYIIVVMDDGADYEEAVNVIRKLSEIVYDYFNK